MVIKERRTKILLLLALVADEYLPIVIDERLQKVFDLSFNQKTRGTLSALLKEGLIEKGSSPPEDLSYKITPSGMERLYLQFPFFRYLKGKWDGKWRILSYEIPEKKRELRDKLRREVSGWGLGPWHRSFWLTPHPIIEPLRNLVGAKEEEQYIQAFEAEHIFGEREILIEKVWGKSKLDKNYRDLFKNWHDLLAGEGEKTDKLGKVINQYVTILKEDPGLPRELVGEGWIGFEAYNIFKEIKGILLG